MGGTKSTHTAKKRISVKESTRDGVLNYDTDNAYPQRMYATAMASGTAIASINLFAKFLRGQGFIDEAFATMPVNRNGLTAEKLLRLTSKDFARYNGFAWHLQYNILGEVTEIFHVPFEHTRLAPPDDRQYIGTIAVYFDWWKEFKKQIKKDAINHLHVFNPRPEVIQAQIEKAGGIQEYKGQVFWWSANGTRYPLTPYDAVIEDIETDAGIKTFNNRGVKSGFLNLSLLVTKGRFETEKDRKAFQANIEDWQGAENSNSVVHVEVDKEEETPEFVSVETKDLDKMFALTGTTIKNNIIQNQIQPKILLGIHEAGKLGSSSDIEDAYDFYNAVTDEDRATITEAFEAVFGNWHEPIAPKGGFDVQPLQFQTDDVPEELLKDLTKDERRALVNREPIEGGDEQLLVEVLGVGGTQAFKDILVDTGLGDQQKIAILEKLFNFTKEEATALVLPVTQPV